MVGVELCEKVSFAAYEWFAGNNWLNLTVAVSGLYSAQIDAIQLHWKDDFLGYSPALTSIVMNHNGGTLWSGNDTGSPTNTISEGTFNAALTHRFANPNDYSRLFPLTFTFSGVPEPLSDHISFNDLIGSSIQISHPSGNGVSCNIPLEYIAMPTSTPYIFPCNAPNVQYGGMGNNGEVSYFVSNYSGTPMNLIKFVAVWPNGGGAYWLRRVHVRDTSATPPTYLLWQSSGDGLEYLPNTDSSLTGIWYGGYIIPDQHSVEIVLDFDPMPDSLTSLGIKDWQFDGTYFQFLCEE